MRFHKAVVVNPPNPPGYVSNKDSMGGFGQLFPSGAPAFPPLDVPYLAAYLGTRSIAVRVIEAGALRQSREELVSSLRAEPDVARSLVLVRTSLPTIDWDLEVCADLRAGVPMGGLGVYGPVLPHVLPRVESDPTIDFMILGEPDAPAAELCAGDALEGIAGLHFRRDGSWGRTPARDFERDLDSLPFPRWDLLPTDRYVVPKSSNVGRQRFLPMLTSRGCPFGCSYCPYPVGQGLKWRHRSPGNVADEMERLVRDFHVEHIVFRDPMFSLQQPRVVALCEEIVRRGIRVSWKCETRVDCLDEGTIEVMARAGCVGINFGVESVDPEVQKGVHRKPILAPEFVSKVAACRRRGIATFAFFVVGLPGDTVETILDSIAFAVEIEANWTQFTVATPFIGTGLHAWATEKGYVAPDFYRIISAHQGSTGNESLEPADVRRLHRFAQRLQNNLLNRRGVLKNETRRDLPYVAAKKVVDHATRGAARTLVAAARAYYPRTIAPRTALSARDRGSR